MTVALSMPRRWRLQCRTPDSTFNVELVDENGGTVALVRTYSEAAYIVRALAEQAARDELADGIAQERHRCLNVEGERLRGVFHPGRYANPPIDKDAPVG